MNRLLNLALSLYAEFEREIIRERVRVGIAQARAEGKALGRPPSAAKKEKEVKRLFAKGLSKSEIARQVGVAGFLS